MLPVNKQDVGPATLTNEMQSAADCRQVGLLVRETSARAELEGQTCAG